MACKKCGGMARLDFPGEHTVIFPGPERIHLSPIYFPQSLLVCLDCGFSELIIPKPELDQLREGIAGSHSKTA